MKDSEDVRHTKNYWETRPCAALLLLYAGGCQAVGYVRPRSVVAYKFVSATGHCSYLTWAYSCRRNPNPNRKSTCRTAIRNVTNLHQDYMNYYAAKFGISILTLSKAPRISGASSLMALPARTWSLGQTVCWWMWGLDCEILLDSFWGSHACHSSTGKKDGFTGAKQFDMLSLRATV